MNGHEPIARRTYAEYLAAEAQPDVRHEFLDGLVYAMAGGTPEDAALAAALSREVGAARGQPCRVFSSDVRVRVRATGLATYPDLTVACGKLETHPEDPDVIVNPKVLFEVLSDSTDAYDRGAKAAHYRRIESLAEYMFIAQHEALIEVYRRNEHGHFELFEACHGEHVEIASIGVQLSVSAVHDNPLAGA